MLDTIVLTAWSGLAVCAVVLATTKSAAPITTDEAKVIWTMHRKTAHCGGHKWQPIKQRKDKIVGFQCECGYKYKQSRPWVCRLLKRHGEHSEHPAPFSFCD